MPPRSEVVTQLTHDQRVELSRKIISQGFSGYEQLSEDLHNQGVEVTHHSIKRWADKLRGALLKRPVTDPNIAAVLADLHYGDDSGR